MNALERRLTRRYTLIHGLFWSLYGVCWGFLAVTLAYAGLSNTRSGMVLCLGLLGSAVAQPLLSSYVDRSGRLTSRGVSILLMLSTALLGLLLWAFLSVPVVFAFLYVLLGISVISINPFLNSMCMELVRRGVAINFGLSRGVGSLTYAATVLLLGGMIERFSPVITLPLTAVLALGVAGAIVLFHPGEAELPPAAQVREAPKSLSTAAFLRANPRFLVVMLGCAMLMGSHCFLTTYMNLVVERVGSAETSMGIALGISAAVEMPAMLLFMRLRRRGVSSGRLFCLSSVFFILKPLALYFAASVTQVYLCLLLQFFTSGFYLPLVPYYVTDTVDSANQVKGQALISTAGTGIGAALASLFGGAICDVLGVDGGILFAAAVAAGGSLCIFLSTAGRRKAGA